jgi:hypothetical protein
LCFKENQKGFAGIASKPFSFEARLSRPRLRRQPVRKKHSAITRNLQTAKTTKGTPFALQSSFNCFVLLPFSVDLKSFCWLERLFDFRRRHPRNTLVNYLGSA